MYESVGSPTDKASANNVDVNHFDTNNIDTNNTFAIKLYTSRSLYEETPMKIGLQTWGSEGDIRPFLALAAGLSQQGHDVSMVATSVDDKQYASIAERYGFKLTLVASPVIPDNQTSEEVGKKIVSEKNPIKQASDLIAELFEPVVDIMYEASQELCQSNDLVIGHFFCYPLSTAAQVLGTPYINVLLMHNIISTRERPPTGMPNLGPWVNKFWWWMLRKVINQALLRFPNALRQRHGLPPANDMLNDVWIGQGTNLIAVSPVFCQPRRDWTEKFKVCGFFNLPDDAMDWEMEPSLKAFLQNDVAPVFITFGSLMPRTEVLRKETIQLFTEAVALARCRAIIQIEQSELQNYPATDQNYYTARTPHAKVFPYCAAVVHHGGAGTTQSATKAGVPSIVVAHIAEQLFWGKTMQRLGIAPPPLQRRSLSAAQLAKRIKLVINTPVMKQTAENLSSNMAEENGVANATKIIEATSNKL
jgi:sterol 3beta-glucosyltransferase